MNHKTNYTLFKIKKKNIYLGKKYFRSKAHQHYICIHDPFLFGLQVLNTQVTKDFPKYLQVFFLIIRTPMTNVDRQHHTPPHKIKYVQSKNVCIIFINVEYFI